jgi:protein SCO1/2
MSRCAPAATSGRRQWRAPAWLRCALLSLLLAAALPGAVHAEGEPADEAAALQTSQRAIGRELGDYDFVGSDGRALRFSSLRGRPVVLSLVYTSCYHVCSGLSSHLDRVVGIAQGALGTQSFSVLTVGFDTANDVPERMRGYARARRVERPGWHFLSTDATTIARLARDVGFTYAASPKGYDHVTQTTLIDAGGRVVLQVYGESFQPPVLVEPLKQLVWGGDVAGISLDELVRTVKLFCTIYDPSTGRYRFDYSLIVEIIAGVLAFGMAAIAIGFAARGVR